MIFFLATASTQLHVFCVLMYESINPTVEAAKQKARPQAASSVIGYEESTTRGSQAVFGSAGFKHAKLNFGLL